MKIKDHIVVKQEIGSGYKFQCLHCGSDFVLIVPADVSELVSLGNTFAKKHNACEKKIEP